MRRDVKESPVRQGQNERIAYVLTTTPWGGYTSGAACSLYDENGNDLSSTLLSGSVSASGDDITSPLVIDLTPGKLYRLYFLWVYSGNTFEAFVEIRAEK